MSDGLAIAGRDWPIPCYALLVDHAPIAADVDCAMPDDATLHAIRIDGKPAVSFFSSREKAEHYRRQEADPDRLTVSCLASASGLADAIAQSGAHEWAVLDPEPPSGKVVELLSLLHLAHRLEWVQDESQEPDQ